VEVVAGIQKTTASFSETLVTTQKNGASQPEHCILDFAIASLPNSQLQ
jgi:hypothetical protein